MQEEPQDRRITLKTAWVRASLSVLIAVVLYFVLIDPSRGWSRRPESLIPPRAPQRPADLVASILKAAPAAAGAWPGYRPFERPLLIAIQGQGSLLLGTTSYPGGFARAAWSEDSVSVSSRIFAPSFSYVKDFDLDGTTVTALRIRGLRSVFDSTGYFIHERFHNVQGTGLFKFGAWEPYPVEDPQDVALAELENHRVGDWVRNGDPEAIRDFAAIRTRRRRLFPGSAAELFEERLEGTARFVELAGNETAWAPASVRRLLARPLAGRIPFARMPKWRHYALGAALCRWLDAEKAPRWRESVEGGLAPSEIVLARLALGEAEISRRVDRWTRGQDYADAEANARRDIAMLKAARERQLAEYDALPGRRLILTSSAAYAGFSGDWVEFPDKTSLVSADEWADERPGFHIRLRDKYIRRSEGRAEFALPPEAIVLLDGRRWVPKPGRTAFRSLSISAPPRIELRAGPGRLDDRGKAILLELDETPR